METPDSDIPVVFFIFNRPDLVYKVFERIREREPKKLIIFCDGPGSEMESWAVNISRDIVSNVDWDCDVERNYADENVGANRWITSGLDRVFSKHDKAIILEEDCIPTETFFPFCERLLKKYENNENIMYVTGFNILGEVDVDADYFFSNCPLPAWGWGTWAKAWDKFKFMEDKNPEVKLEEFRRKNLFDTGDYPVFGELLVASTFYREKVSWDLHWFINILENEGLAAISSKNQISNHGFDDRGINPISDSKIMKNLDRYNLSPPYEHPESVVPDRKFTELILDEWESFVRDGLN